MATLAETQTETQYADTPAGWAKRWGAEFTASKKAVEEWHRQGGEIVKRFLDKRETGAKKERRWSLFTANVQTQQAMLYGKVPKADVSRRFADAEDDVARVAGEMLERILNSDIERDSHTFASDLESALSDRFLPGMGSVRNRYVAEFGMSEPVPAQVDPMTGAVIAPEVPAQQVKESEDVESEYIHWRDQLWSAGARTFSEVRWWAFKTHLSRSELVAKFGKKVGARIPLKRGKGEEKDRAADPWQRAELWEIWDKEHLCTWYFVEGFDQMLTPIDLVEGQDAEGSESTVNANGSVKDPLGLENFWPFARPLMANLTTDEYLPRPDYVLVQDLYREIDVVSTRISVLVKAVRLVGAYDKTNTELKRMLKESGENEMIPVSKWAALMEKGGLKGQIEWMPLEQVVAILDKLRDVRTELVGAVYQLTGMSDIVRGQASDVGATATEQRIKARSSSVRIQKLQDELARFATDTQKIRAEIICKHWDPRTIIERSNILATPDAQHAEAAVQLLKSKGSMFRVAIKSEALGMTDFAELQAERAGVLTAISQFVQSMAPLIQAMPGAMPTMLRMLQWAVSGLKGSAELEGILDGAIAELKAAAAQPQQARPAPPDPKLMLAQAKAQADMAKIQAETQAHITKAQVDVQAEGQKQQVQTEQNVKEAVAIQHIKRLGTGPAPVFGPNATGGA